MVWANRSTRSVAGGESVGRREEIPDMSSGNACPGKAAWTRKRHQWKAVEVQNKHQTGQKHGHAHYI